MKKTDKILCILFCSYACYLISIADGRSEQINEEARVFEDLFVKTRYDNSVRPVRNKSSPVQVYLDIALVQLIDLDDADQSMQSNIWIRMKWTNEILTWNPADYGNVTSIVVNKIYPWKPDIVLYNSADSGESRGYIGEFLTRIEVSHIGMNTWYIPAILKSSCSTDMTLFPFDSQVCSLTFGSWTYFRNHINITNTREVLDLRSYQISSSFSLRKTTAIRKETFYPCCPDPIVTITYELQLDRQPGFYFYNVILPTLVITLMAFITFAMPDSIGERVGLTFDCFLANTFTAMMIKDMLPVSSDTVPIITRFMLMCMSMLLLSLFSNAFSLRCRNKTHMPFIVRKLFLQVLGPLVLVNTSSCAASVDENENDGVDGERRKNITASRFRYHESLTVSDLDGESYEMLRLSKDASSQSSGYPATNESCSRGDNFSDYQYKKRYFSSAKSKSRYYKQPFSSGFHSFESELEQGPTRQQLDCLEGMKTLVDSYESELIEKHRKDFWDFVSKIVDRLLLVCFLLAWISMALALFLKVPTRSDK